MKGGQRGGVLVSVMLLIALLGYVGVLLLSSSLRASTDTAGATRRTAQDLSAQSAINALWSAWAVMDATCASNATLGVSCSGSGCSCICSLASGVEVTVSAAPEGPACRLAVRP